MSVGENLKYFRRLRGMSQIELASKSGVIQTTISAIERGSDPSGTILKNLSNALGVTADDLLKEKVAK